MGDVLGRLEKSIEIQAPPEKIWELLAFDRSPEWMGDMTTKAEYTSEIHSLDDKFKVGTTAFAWTHSGIGSKLEIIESLKYEKMTTRSTSSSRWKMTSISTFTLKPTQRDTEVSYVMDYEFHSILGKMLNKLVFDRWAETEYEKALQNLKSLLEQS